MNENKDLERPPKEFIFSLLVTTPELLQQVQLLNEMRVEEMRRRKGELIVVWGFFCV